MEAPRKLEGASSNGSDQLLQSQKANRKKKEIGNIFLIGDGASERIGHFLTVYCFMSASRTNLLKGALENTRLTKHSGALDTKMSRLKVCSAPEGVVSGVELVRSNSTLSISLPPPKTEALLSCPSAFACPQPGRLAQKRLQRG